MTAVKNELYHEVTGKVKAKAKLFDPEADVILFGSRARGDFRDDSDWDFLILTDRLLNEDIKSNLRFEFFDTELETNQCFFSLIENRKEWEELRNVEIYQNIKEEGILV